MYNLNDNDELRLKKNAFNIRKNILRLIKADQAGHVGGALSSVEIMTALYFQIMKVDHKNPMWEQRDRFVLSAGHKCLALYATLAEKGFFDKSLLDTYGSIKSIFPGHPDMHKVPGVESNTGALGHGLAIGGGMAMGLKMSALDARVYVILGDGELAEGSNWEAAAAASHHGLDNLLAIIDNNGLQIGGSTSDIMSYEPLDERWRSFGWSVRKMDGHNLKSLVEAMSAIPFEKGKPSLIIADTIKSKGFSFAENKANYHYWKATTEEIKQAEKDLAEIERRLD